jgi:adenylate cyclase
MYWLNFRAPKRWLLHSKRDIDKVGKVANLADIESPYRRVSFMDILDGQLTPEQRKALKGSVVLIGSTALGYFDHYPTPFTSQAPGVEYHATFLDNLLNEDFRKPVARLWMILVVVAMIWLPMGLHQLAPASGALVTGAVALVLWLFTGWLFTKGWRVDFIAPLTALFCAFVAQTVHRVLTEGAEKKFIKNVFGQFVAPEVVDDLVKDPGKVKLGGEKRDMTIFFLDIAHFTTISEKMAPEALIIFLNKYLSALSHVVHEQKGVVDKYIGDCIMAFWNAPIELKDHRSRACLAAIECQEAMNKLNVSLPPGMPETPAIRIGLNSGDATVGLTGSDKKLQYTVIGDEVNLASRLEGANKFFGSKIMASEATFGGAKDVVEARELGRVRVVGKDKPILVYELLAKKGQLSNEWKIALPRYEKGLALFSKRDYAEAALEFAEVVKVFPNDGPATLYLNAARDYAAIPPDENWDGVFNLTAK